jgi:ribonuclease HI
MIIYTDGAASNNGCKNSVGGWAFVIVDHMNNIIEQGSGRIERATNNQCELTAAIEACKCASQYSSSFTLYSDSAYLINCYKEKWYKKWIENNWVNSKKQSVANQDLWIQLIPFFENPKFNFEKVKGHSDDNLNILVDKMAVEAKQC